MRSAAITLCAVVAAVLLIPGAAEAAACANVSVRPASATVAQVRSSTLCLLNSERRARGLAPLREEPRLRLAATRHSDDMVARDYFDHTAPGGLSMVTRIARTGYIRGVNSWALGENIAWGSGILSTPARIVHAWMHSSGHRANILSSSFREIGIGVSVGTPRGIAGATYTTDFGMRG